MVLDSFSIFLHHGVCASIVKHRSDSYCSSFISDDYKKIAQKLSLHSHEEEEGVLPLVLNKKGDD